MTALPIRQRALAPIGTSLPGTRPLGSPRIATIAEKAAARAALDSAQSSQTRATVR